MPPQRLDALLAAAEVLGHARGSAPRPPDRRPRPPAPTRPATVASRSHAAIIHPSRIENKTIGPVAAPTPSAQRKTIAGSSRITRWTLSRLDRTQIRTIAPAVIGRSCQGV